jgi:predicted solute-binding protein
LIGDRCLKARTLWPGHQFHDLSGAWKELTGLPFVFAVWVGRRGVFTRELAGRLSTALDDGLARAPALVDAALAATGWPRERLLHYLTVTIRHRLDARFTQGLREFARRCEALGLVPPGAAARVA